MGDIRTAANAAFRDSETAGVPASGDHDPVKADIRATFGVVEDKVSAVEAVAGTGIVWNANAIRVRSTANVVIATALENGDTLNGVTLVTGNHVFLGAQTAPAENGIYTVVASGAASRAAFANSAAELAKIGFVIREGTVGAGERYTLPIAAADITLGTTALNFALTGIEVDYATAAAPSLAKAEWAVQFGAIHDSAEIVGSALASQSQQARTNDFSGFGDIIEPPSETINGIYLPTIHLASGGSGGGVTTPHKPVRIDVYVRTGISGQADNAGATILAIGSISVDPEGSPWSGLFVPLRDPGATDPGAGELGDFIDIEAGDWGAEAGIMIQGWDAAGDYASINQPNGSRDDRVTPARSYFLTNQDGRTSLWAPLSGNPGIGFQLAFMTGLRDDYTASPALAASLAQTVTTTVPPGDIYGEWRLRNIRDRLFLLGRGFDTQLDIAFIGDSWTDATFRYVERVAEVLMEDYGDAGPGWIGFGFPASDTDAINGNAREAAFVTTKTGTWTSDFFNGDSAGPGVSNAKSSSAGAKYTITADGSSTAVLSTMTFIWEGTADGVTRYRWNGGSWTTRNVQGSGIQSANLAGVPGTAAWTLEIEVVSGSVALCGLNGQSAAPGVRIHKLGCSGARADQWADSDATQWEASLALLGLDAVFLEFGTNEKAAGTTPSVFKGALETLLTRAKVARPGLDVGIMMPCENLASGVYAMSDYASAAFSAAETMDAAWLNLQPLFGMAAADYAFGAARPRMLADNAHPRPSSQRGFYDDDIVMGTIPDAIVRLMTR